jgi:glycosyltransferase involved in cell wall biosynthesis
VSSLAGLSVVLACFNEEDNIGRAVRSTAAAAGRASDDYEIIVVDDGSLDGSLPVASDFARRDPHVRVLVHAGTRGYGAAVRTGISAARMPWILLTDAGLPVDPEELENFLPLTQIADLVVGWRSPRDGPLTRRLAAGARDLLVRRVLGVPVHDAGCAFKLVRRELVGGLPLSSSGTAIGTELIVRALVAGARVREVEVGLLWPASVAGDVR